ncbi:Uncharacterised protein [Vibrio cholerae]|uniref:Uncharacterized protein n=1 Tax=Vibrio cholerae TaxID=666 RepID=A0A656A3I0_VIBCL|nr:Uncharacterised protein [Vibrio cholerae]CSB23110.1 Uncharacterised protein [Vibrio cholerae]CSB27870.1 Uncharacterised protein [Vibrio cholerae]CSB81872.1 Uncharacterised protein [Vibrio cholerae]CSC08128.1 Uncharacterised protein [Vibrio cholerae]
MLLLFVSENIEVILLTLFFARIPALICKRFTALVAPSSASCSCSVKPSLNRPSALVWLSVLT